MSITEERCIILNELDTFLNGSRIHCFDLFTSSFLRIIIMSSRQSYSLTDNENHVIYSLQKEREKPASCCV